MSILIKGNNSGCSSGSGKGFPVENVNNVEVKGSYKKVFLKWQDPDNTIIGGVTISTWSSTVIVRKEGSAPTSIKDGVIILTNTTKNKYKDIYYEDQLSIKETTYYYRFFTMNTDKIYNTDSKIYTAKPMTSINAVLKNNTWEQISLGSESGIASDLWKVGDEIDITLSGIYNETVTLQIWDFNHFDKSDGSGKAGICFGMKNLMKECEKMIPYSDSDFHYWKGVTMRTTVMKNILKSMPSDLQNVIKEVNTYASVGGGESTSYIGELSKDKVFLPGFTEVDNSYSAQNITESGQKKFPIFTDNNSRIKKLSNGSGNARDWWTRSQYWGAYGGRTFIYIANNGDGAGRYDPAHYDNGVCFCFNI